MSIFSSGRCGKKHGRARGRPRLTAAGLALLSSATAQLAEPHSAGPQSAGPQSAEPQFTGSSPRLGRPISAAEAAAWDLSVYPDGSGLPPGSGRAGDGERLYRQHCQACHGPGGIGLSAPALVASGEPLDGDWPERTVGNYWPYASTLFDFIRRAKPMRRPGSFRADQVYALCAYLLSANALLAEDAELDAAGLRAIEMPNRHGFIVIDAPPAE